MKKTGILKLAGTFYLCGLSAIGLMTQFLATSLAVDPVPQTVVQDISLRAGWNAIFIEVDPIETDPNLLFSGLPIELVASLLKPATSAQYIQNPSEIGWNREGWATWRSPRREDSFLSDLFSVRGFRCYLILATAESTLRIAGKPGYKPIAWKPNAYNFVGFGLDTQNLPTFGNFFSASPAHKGQSIFRLQDGKWKPVLDPAATSMQAGEALWVYCKGSSAFQGPLEVDLPILNELHFGALGSRLSIGFKNVGDTPCTVHVTPTPGDDALPLLTIIKHVSTLETIREPLSGSATLLLAGADGSGVLTLAPFREKMKAPAQSTILEIIASSGTRLLIPVAATRSTLAAQP
jgi:hypothetical protein